MTEPAFPTKVRVGYRTYRVEPITAREASSGNIRGQARLPEWRILVDRVYPPLEQAEILVHEIMHCVFAEMARRDVSEPDEEWHCSVTGNALTQVMRDSPELRTWLAWAWAQED